MPLHLEPVELKDFDTMLNYVHNRGEDLIAPLVSLVWPTSSDDASNADRNRWSLKQQREIFEDDPTVTFLKVVDSDNEDDIIALARWHFYEYGYDLNMLAWELNGRASNADDTWPDGMNVSLAKEMLVPIFETRQEWMGQKPMWVLTTLMTKESQRRRGAGSMLVEWGVKQARKDQVPAFIEATPAGQPLYEKFGFKCVGRQSFDLKQFGFPEPIVLSRMEAVVDS